MGFITARFHSVVQGFGDAPFASSLLPIINILTLLFVFLLRISWPAEFLGPKFLNSSTRIGFIVGIRQFAWSLFISPLSVTGNQTKLLSICILNYPAKISYFSSQSRISGELFSVWLDKGCRASSWHLRRPAKGWSGQWRLAWVNLLLHLEKEKFNNCLLSLVTIYSVIYPATLQITGFSPVCSLWCVFSCPLWVNALPHEG